MHAARTVWGGDIGAVRANSSVVGVCTNEIMRRCETVHARAPRVRAVSPPQDGHVVIHRLAVDRETPRGLLGLLSAQGGLDPAGRHHDAAFKARDWLFCRGRRLARKGRRWRERSEAVHGRKAGIRLRAAVTLRCWGCLNGGGSGDRGGSGRTRLVRRTTRAIAIILRPMYVRDRIWRDRWESRGSTPIGVVLDVDGTVVGLKVGEATLI